MDLFSRGRLNAVIAVSAMFISGCALIVSIQEIRIMRTQMKATMYPYLTVGRTYNSEGFGIRLKNSGNGIARIHSYQIFMNDTYFRDWNDIIDSLAPAEHQINYSIMSTNSIRNEMITPGESVTLFFVQWTEETRALEEKFSLLNFSINYSSLLDDYWNISRDGTTTLESSPEIDFAQEFDL